MSENSWISNYFPNLTTSLSQPVLLASDSFTKKSLEKMINLLFADQVDKILMRIRSAWFRRKHACKFSKMDFEVAFKSKKYVSKAHSTNGQAKILSLYEKKLVDQISSLVP